MADYSTNVDRSIVRCSVTQQILAIFRQPRLNDFSRAGLIFLLVTFLCIKAKKSNNQAIGQKNRKLGRIILPIKYCFGKLDFMSFQIILKAPLINVQNDKRGP